MTHPAMIHIRSLPFRLFACLMAALLAAGCSKEAKKSQLQSRAQAFLDAGEFEKAKIAYLNVLQKDPGNALAIAQLGRIWSEQGSPMQARPYLLKTRQLNPNDIELRKKLVSNLLSLNQRKDAHAEAAAILSLAPSDGEALILLAESASNSEERDATLQRIDAFPLRDSADRYLAPVVFLMYDKDYLGAEEAVARALAADPKSVRALVAAGTVRIELNDADGAEKRFKEAAELTPMQSPQRVQLADYIGRRGRLDEARAMAAEICKRAPEYLPAWTLAARLASDAKQYDDALAALDQVFAIDPMNYPARLLQAQFWVSKQDYAKAIELLQKLQSAYPGQPNVKYQLGRAYLQNGEPEKAATVLREAVTLLPDFAEAAFMLAQIDLRSGRAEAVIPAMKRILEKRPGLMRAAIAMADAYQVLGRNNEALEVMRSVVTSAPASVDYRLRLARMLLQAGQAEAARAAVEKALELSPNDPAAMAQLVELDLAAGAVEAAEARAKELLAAKPQSAAAHVVMAQLHARREAWSEAEAELLKAIELDAGFSDAYDLLIQVQVSAGKLPEALQQVESLLARTPDDPRAVKRAAMLYSQQKDYEKAAAQFERLLTLAPEPMAMNNLAYIYSEQLNKADRAFELARQAREMRQGVELASTPAIRLEAASIADTLGWLLYKRGDYQQAYALAGEAAAHLGENPEVQFHLGMSAYEVGELEAARTALKRATESADDFPGKAEAATRLGLLAVAGAQGETLSLAELEKQIEQHPDDANLRVRLAELLEKSGEAARAAAAYEASLERVPTLARSAMKLARLYGGPLKDQAKGLEYAKKARQLAPADPKIAAVLGDLVFQRGDHPYAYNLLKESAQSLKEDPVVLRSLAWAAYSQAKIEELRTALQTLLKVAPEAPEAAEAAALLALTEPSGQDGPAAEAVAKAETALAQDAGHVPALMTRAAHQEAKGEDAAATYRAILELWPAFAPAQKRLASLYAELPDKGAEAYELAAQARKVLSDDADLAVLLAVLSYGKEDYKYALQLLAESARVRPLDAKGLYYQGRCQIKDGDAQAGQASLEQALAAGLTDPLAAEARTAIEELAKP